MDEKRMVGDYTVINSMYIGHREIILGENPKAASGERYVCCYAERVMFYEQYLEAQVSDDFAEIVKLYPEDTITPPGTWTRRATSAVMTFTMMAPTTISTGFTRMEFPNIKRTG